MPGQERLTELLLGQFGTLVLALLIIYGFLTERIVSGNAYRREVDRAARLERLAMRSTNVAERVTTIAEAEKEGPP